ncbi:MAG: sulfatase-like hydrolase/transferase [Polyangiaceae bacterium]
MEPRTSTGTQEATGPANSAAEGTVENAAPPPTARSPLAELASSLRRGAFVVTFAFLTEVLLRAATRTVHFPDVTTAAGEHLAHFGRVAVLAVPLIFLDALVSALVPFRNLRSVHDALLAPFANATALRRIVGPLLAAVVAFVAASWIYKGRTQRVPPFAMLVAVTAFCSWFSLGAIVVRLRRGAEPSTSSRWGALVAIGTVTFAIAAGAAFFMESDVAVVTALLFNGLLTRSVVIPSRAGNASDVRASGVARAGRRASAPLFVVVALLGLGFDLGHRDLRRFFSLHCPFDAYARTLLARLTDVDGDRASSLYGTDCDDFDPRRRAFAEDIPDDGIDQNCHGGDSSLEAALSRWEPGGVHAEVEPAGPVRPPPPVVFVSVDALRADTFTDRSIFPKTQEALERCVHFTNARANTPSTWPSMFAMHMGVSFSHITTPTGGIRLVPADPAHGVVSRPPSLASVLSVVGGYATVFAVPPFRLPDMSFLTGFTETVLAPPTGNATFPRAPVMFRILKDTVAKVESAAKDSGRPPPPVLQRVHLMDLHAPYATGYDRAAYDEGARRLDRHLATFLREIPAETIVIVTADHGEAFGEHGYYDHGGTLFDEELRVPLVLCAPAFRAEGLPRKVDALVSHVDIPPTLFELVGVTSPYLRHGESLVPLVTRSRTRKLTWSYAENVIRGQRAVVEGCEKFLEDGRGFKALFDLCADPSETRNVAETEPRRFAELQRRMDEIVDLDVDAVRSWRVGSRKIGAP